MTPTQKFIAHIRALIAKDDFKAAIQELSALLKDSPLLDKAVQQSARYNNVTQQIRLGLVDFQSANIAKNQIRYGVLELLREIEEQEQELQAPAILELLREIEEQAQQTPAIKAEVERFEVKIEAVKIEKNVVNNSTINAGRDVHIGDMTVMTESTTSRRLRLFLYAFVPILALALAFLYIKNQELKEPLNLTVVVTDATPNPNLPLSKATVTLTYGDKTETQTVEKEANFKGIPANFKNQNATLQVEADGFVRLIRPFVLSDNHISVPLSRDNSLAMVFGNIKDAKGYPVADAQVTVQDMTVSSGSGGFYRVQIPADKQRKTQRVKAFKQGFKVWDYETPVVAAEPVNIILLKTGLSYKNS